MKKGFVLLFLVSVVGGCECNPNNYNWRGYNECGEYNPLYDTLRKETYVTKVISEPPGARIELDNDYIGNAPLEIRWEGWPENKTFANDHEVKALPIYEGQYTQCKFFYGWGSRHDKIPTTILFDMNLLPVPTRYEIDIE